MQNSSIISYFATNSDDSLIPTKVDDLKKILKDKWTKPELSYDNVFHNLIIGDEFVATNIKTLKALKITHILNASQGMCCYSYVDTNESFYSSLNFHCKFHGIPAENKPDFQLYYYFWRAAAFIEDGIKGKKNGKVLVHSQQGTSRAATIIIAFLMVCRNYTATNALKFLRSKRNIAPNDGFLQQLSDLDYLLTLSKMKEAALKSPITTSIITTPPTGQKVTESEPMPTKATIPVKTLSGVLQWSHTDGSPNNETTTVASNAETVESVGPPKVKGFGKKILTAEERELKRKKMSLLAAALRKTAADMDKAEAAKAAEVLNAFATTPRKVSFAEKDQYFDQESATTQRATEESVVGVKAAEAKSPPFCKKHANAHVCKLHPIRRVERKSPKHETVHATNTEATSSAMHISSTVIGVLNKMSA